MESLFWPRVKRQLKAHKITQVKFAEYVGLSPGTLRGWIHHNRIPDAVSACYIADALGVTVEYLVRGIDGLAASIRMKQVEEQKTASARVKNLVAELEEESKKLR